MTSPLRSLWDAPAAVPPPPRRVWRDWVLVAVLPLVAVFEAAVRPDDVPWRWLWVGVLVALVPTLLWRRTHPLLMLAIAFGVGSIFSVVTGGDPQLVTTAYFLLLVYAVVRWGSGRAMVAAGAILLASSALSFALGPTSIGDAVGGLAVVAATVSLGVAFRWRAAARARELDRVKLLEREQLARDLHDTVAHHVSAIAIQAQAGTAVAATDPDAAAEVLRVIEGEASRTLDEMRSMVRVLRRDDVADRSPGPGIADLRRLAHADTGGPGRRRPAGRRRRGGAPDGRGRGVSPRAGGGDERAAARPQRHPRRRARRGRRRGDPARGAQRRRPRGIRDPRLRHDGMVERATLLGGTCEAGPAPGGGWTVTAVLPRSGWST